MSDLCGKTDGSDVPYIFINQVYIGDYSDLEAKRADLPTLLKDPGAANTDN